MSTHGKGVALLAEVLEGRIKRIARAGGPAFETGIISGGVLNPDELQQPVPLSDCQKLKGVQIGEGARVLIVWSSGGPIIIGVLE